ncbi:MAG: ABC transporter ATP-binding protein [Clostridiales bacterium]|nr:ABC transporter ATP-binding protein [Clostridiales bacterium]
MNLLSVKSLRKQYPSFLLDDISFDLEPGCIMGFIGRNGAGKTTTMKAMLNLIKRDGGSVFVDGMDFFENESECKQKIGFIMGEFNCYMRSKLKTIADVTKRFYKEWDDSAYKGYLEKFSLDENKKIRELSAGMRVKFALALALSHNAKLLILDEPTSGLDPVSRNELLDVLRSLVEDGTRSVLFSTHIISDLEKCADFIGYIKNGKLFDFTDTESFRNKFMLVSGEQEHLESLKTHLISYKENAFGFSGLIKAEDAGLFSDCRTAPADLESIMVYVEQEEEK